MYCHSPIGHVVELMSQFTPSQRAAIIAESRRLLSKATPTPSPPPSPPRPLPVNIVCEDDVARWRREADEASAIRAANRAELKRETRESRRAAIVSRQEVT